MPSQPSKEAINRAGAAIAEVLAAFNAGDLDEVERLEQNEEQLNAAVDLIDWWRSQHAKPLTSLSANLRYYLKPHGPVVVTQRLKRAPTMIDKLLREPTMKLTQMADIGGRRALLVDQAAVYAVTKTLRRNWEVERVRDYAAEPKASGPSPPVLTGHSIRPRRSACRESRRPVWMEHWRRMSSALSSEP